MLGPDHGQKSSEKVGAGSPEFKALTNKFLVLHGLSYGCSMITMVTSIVYAMCIAERSL